MDVDLQADLNLEDDDGLNYARITDAANPRALRPGAVLRAGRGRTWSWVRIMAIEESGRVQFKQISGGEARRSLDTAYSG
jgi:hypothetical protein